LSRNTSGKMIIQSFHESLVCHK